MANFKIGDKVRIVGVDKPSFWPSGRPPIGRAGVIVGIATEPGIYPWVVAYEGPDCSGGDNEFGLSRAAFQSHELAPLTDPKAEAFIESIKKLKPYEEPKHLPTFDPPIEYDRTIGSADWGG